MRILLSDRHYLALDKPSGVPVHPGTGHEGRSLIETVAAEHGRLFPVHRLDSGTSGIVVLARSSEAAARLAALFASSDVRKAYVALVKGRTHDKGRVDKPLRQRRERTGEATMVEAETAYRRIESGRGWSLLRVEPGTGRGHQIRRHLARIGHPILGDDRHGDRVANEFFRREAGLDRMFLHASSLSFRHPWSGELVALRSDVPQELEYVLSRLRGAPCR